VGKFDGDWSEGDARGSQDGSQIVLLPRYVSPLLYSLALTHMMECVAYLTFVAKPIPPPVPSFLLSLSHKLHLATPEPPKRSQVPSITPVSTLESKRYLLAGRRRGTRIQGREKSEALLGSFRAQVLDIERAYKFEQTVTTPETQAEKEALIQALQLELMVEA
jgi:hypothetical protein